MVITENSPSLQPYVPIADFYAGKSIFLTGGTGFLGEVLIEKLLYSCPDIANVYLLVREKKGVSPQDRVKSFFNSPVFNRLNKERPENLKKVKFISGELTQADLGITPRDMKMLCEEVSIVFHLAATVKFNEPLCVAVKVNVEGTEEVLKLCRNMSKIEVFVHMSTLFANADHEDKIFEEKLYPSPKTLDEVYKMIDEHNKDKVFTQSVLGGRPNTYTFTKALAENLIVQKRGELPTIIIRPSAVSASKEEPSKGWIGHWMGATLSLYLQAKGWCRTLYGKEHYTIPLIPVDYVVNLTIISTARFSRSKDIQIFNSCTSSVNPLSFKDSSVYFLNESRRQRFFDFPLTNTMYTTSEWLMCIRDFLFGIIPAFFADVILFIIWKPVRFVRQQRRGMVYTSAVKYFTSRNWFAETSNGQALHKSLSQEDQNMFPCDPTDIIWKDYMTTYFNGIKTFLIKEK